MVCIIVGIELGRVKGFETGGQNNGADVKFHCLGFLCVEFKGDGFGTASFNTRVTLTTITAVQASIRLGFSRCFRISQLDLVKIIFSFCQRELRHGGAFFDLGVCWNGAVNRVFSFDGLSAHGHVIAVQVANDGFSRFLAGGNRPYGNPGSGLDIPAGKNAFPSRSIGNGVNFRGTPSGNCQTCDIFNAAEIRSLAYGWYELIDFDIIFTSRHGYGASSARRIHVAQLHSNTSESGNFTVGRQGFLGSCQISNFNAFRFGSGDFLFPCRHFRSRSPVDDGDVFGTHPHGTPRHIYSDVTTAYNGNFFTNFCFSAEVDFPQKIDTLTNSP